MLVHVLHRATRDLRDSHDVLHDTALEKDLPMDSVDAVHGMLDGLHAEHLASLSGLSEQLEVSRVL